MAEAYIVKIKDVKKHSNADRLQVGTCFGNQVIVGLDTQEGETGLYFASDSQLGLEFCEANNLIKKKNPITGENIGGYLDGEKRHIRAMKLRGEISDGLFVPLTSLESFTDISKLKEGEKITVLNGIEICRKYVPKTNQRQHSTKVGKPKQAKKEELISYPNFNQHIDTKHVMRELKQFKVGDICYITLKMHGCFVKNTRVRTGYRKTKKIQDIKVGDTVLGYNSTTGKIEPTKVLQVFHNDSSDKWRKIKVSRDGVSGDKRGYITCTPNHPFWVEEQGRYINAKDMSVGTKVSTLFPSKILTQQQKDIMIGSFLGDGCLLDFGKRVAEIQTSSKKEQERYQDYLISITNNLLYKGGRTYMSGYGTEMVRSRTCRSADMYNYFKDVCLFNNQNGDKLKSGLVDKFTQLSMAIFYMDDGSLSHSEGQKDRASFAICDYNDRDAEIICDCFRKFSIEPTLYKDSNGYNRIRLNTKEAYKLFDLIHEFIPPIMRYKLPIEYRSLDFKSVVDSEKMEDGYVLSEQIVLENIAVNENHKEYDMETEQHNYIVGLSIVHNTSARVANQLKKEKIYHTGLKKIIAKIFKKLPYETVESYDYVSGSRRVTLKNFDDGYYKDNGFRKKWHDFFVGKLHESECVYGEIVGYQENGKPFMGTVSNKKTKDKNFIKKYGEETAYHYGCEVGENDFYIYRMTVTTSDGMEVDLPWDMVKLRAEQMGAKTVPEFERFVFTTEEDLIERVNKYIDGEDPIGLTHVREGAVVRIEGRERFKAFKHKGYYFKLLEGIIKDAGIVDMEEMESIEE